MFEEVQSLRGTCIFLVHVHISVQRVLQHTLIDISILHGKESRRQLQPLYAFLYGLDVGSSARECNSTMP